MSRSLTVVLLASMSVLGACAATTGVIAIGGDTYSVSHRDYGPAASLGALKAKAYKDASAFCAGKNQEVEVIKTNDIPRSLGQFPEAEVVFKCAPKK